jgi:pyruvate/2-oxoglutarate dehydrogenase complex dihydrolipoamide acyltransferase (E2) component
MRWCQIVKHQHVQITLPDLGTSRIKFSLWYVQLGEMVLEGDRIAEVSIPGATYDVQAPAEGKLIERTALPNDLLAAGQVLGVIEGE